MTNQNRDTFLERTAAAAADANTHMDRHTSDMGAIYSDLSDLRDTIRRTYQALHTGIADGDGLASSLADDPEVPSQVHTIQSALHGIDTAWEFAIFWHGTLAGHLAERNPDDKYQQFRLARKLTDSSACIRSENRIGIKAVPERITLVLMALEAYRIAVEWPTGCEHPPMNTYRWCGTAVSEGVHTAIAACQATAPHDMVSLRYPELKYQEVETSRKITQILSGAVRLYGVIAVHACDMSNRARWGTEEAKDIATGVGSIMFSSGEMPEFLLLTNRGPVVARTEQSQRPGDRHVHTK